MGLLLAILSQARKGHGFQNGLHLGYMSRDNGRSSSIENQVNETYLASCPFSYHLLGISMKQG